MSIKTDIKEANGQQAQNWEGPDDFRWAVRQWASRIGVKAPRIYILHMKSKWASISTNGRLSLNYDLLSLPRELGEYVIVHELVHLLAPNHGKLFQSFMLAYMPDWEEREKKLQLFAQLEI